MSDPWHDPNEGVNTSLILLPEPPKRVDREDGDFEYATTRYRGPGIPISGADYPRPDSRYGWEMLTVTHDQRGYGLLQRNDILDWRRSKRMPPLVDIKAHIERGDYPKNEHGQWVVPMRCGLNALIDSTNSSQYAFSEGVYCIVGSHQLWVDGPFDRSQWLPDGHGMGAYDSYYLLPPGVVADPEEVAQFNRMWEAHPEWKRKEQALTPIPTEQPLVIMAGADIGLAATIDLSRKKWGIFARLFASRKSTEA